MQRTPYQTYLAERLQSARGLGWVMPENPPLSKGCGRDFCAGGLGDALSNPPQPPFKKGGGGVPAWFRLAHAMLHRLGFTR
jgi:hypothetical protein